MHGVADSRSSACVCVWVGWRRGLLEWGCGGSSYRERGEDTELFSDSKDTKRGMK